MGMSTFPILISRGRVDDDHRNYNNVLNVWSVQIRIVFCEIMSNKYQKSMCSATIVVDMAMHSHDNVNILLAWYKILSLKQYDILKTTSHLNEGTCICDYLALVTCLCSRKKSSLSWSKSLNSSSSSASISTDYALPHHFIDQNYHDFVRL